MKNLLVLAVTVALLYFGYDAMQPPPAPPHPAPAPAKLVAPNLPPKLFFHSSLDAPAMSTHATTGTGYFSTDPNSRFTASYGGGYGSSGGAYVEGSSAYLVLPGNGRAAAAPASRSPFTAISGAEPYRPPAQGQAASHPVSKVPEKRLEAE